MAFKQFRPSVDSGEPLRVIVRGEGGKPCVEGGQCERLLVLCSGMLTAYALALALGVETLREMKETGEVESGELTHERNK